MEGLGAEIECGDAEYAVRLRIGNVDNSKVPPRAGLANGDPSAVVAGSIFEGRAKDVLGLILTNPMAVHVRFLRFGIDIESDIHLARDLSTAPLVTLNQLLPVANADCETPRGLRNSSRSIAPGCTGGTSVGSRRRTSGRGDFRGLLVVVRDFDFIGIAGLPAKADSILLIDEE